MQNISEEKVLARSIRLWDAEDCRAKASGAASAQSLMSLRVAGHLCPALCSLLPRLTSCAGLMSSRL